MSTTPPPAVRTLGQPSTGDRDPLEHRVAALEERLDEREAELRATREWVGFLEEEVEAYRERAEQFQEERDALERECERLEGGPLTKFVRRLGL